MKMENLITNQQFLKKNETIWGIDMYLKHYPTSSLYSIAMPDDRQREENFIFFPLSNANYIIQHFHENSMLNVKSREIRTE